MTPEAILTILKSKGFKITPNRRLIIQILSNHIHHMLTIDEIYEEVKSQSQKINKSTLYRNIELFQELDLLHKKIIDKATASYKLICSQEHHHHMICDMCGKIVVYHACDNEAYQAFAKSHDFILTGHTLELHGICNVCQKKTS